MPLILAISALMVGPLAWQILQRWTRIHKAVGPVAGILMGLVMAALIVLIMVHTVGEGGLIAIVFALIGFVLPLAAEKGITDYACPAGGCLLTDKAFGRRLRDLLDHEPDADVPEVRMLKYGRHFRLPDGAKVIVGRDETENDTLERLGNDYAKYQVEDELGAVALAPPNLDEDTKKIVASITARYSKAKENPTIRIKCSENGREQLIEAAAATEDDLATWRLA